MATTVARGNILLQQVVAVTINPNSGTSIPANSTVETTIALRGVRPNDFVSINKPSHTAGLTVSNVRVPARDQLAIQFANVTGSAVAPTQESYLLLIERCEYQPIPTTVSA